MAYQDAGPGVDQDGGFTAVVNGPSGAVARAATDASSTVAQATKAQVRDVAGESKRQARDLVGEAGAQVYQQAGIQKDRLVQGLLVLGEELEAMAEQSRQRGIAARTARQMSERALELAEHVDSREPTDLLDQARSFARRRSAIFLAGAAVSGVVAGRLTRALAPADAPTGEKP